MSRRSSLAEYTVAELRSTEGLTFERVFVSDTFQRGIYELDLADGSTADNLGLVLVTTDGKRYKRILDTPVVSTEWFKTAANTNVTANLNIALQLSTVKKVIVWNDTTISGTLTVPADKVLAFQTGGKFVGTATISGGIVEAPYEQQIFDVNITATIQGAAEGVFSGRWFGASPSASASVNAAALQKALDTCIARLIPKLYLPKGTYSINKGLLMYAGPATHVALHFYGDRKSQTDGSKETWINCTHADNFGIGIHIGKGVIIENLGIQGVNQLNYSQLQLLDVTSTFLTNGARDNQYSPYAGIVFEPFHQNVTGGNRYPGFESYYAAISITGGSTSCIVKDVTINGFTVARVLGPNGTTQNNESHVFERNWIGNCREAFVSCVSQERTTVIRDENIWTATKTCYHTGKYGNLFGDPPHIYTLNVAGAVFEIINWNGTGYSPMLKMENIHAEELYRIGTVVGQANFVNCRFHFSDPSLISDSYGVQSWILNCNGLLSFDNCQLFHYNNYGGFPTRFIGISDEHGCVIVFRNSATGIPTTPRIDGAAYPEDYSSRHFDYINSYIYGMSGRINRNSVPTGLFETSYASKTICPNIGTEILLGVGSYQGNSSQHYLKHKVTSPLYRSTYVHPAASTVTITKVGNEATFDLDNVPNLVGKLKVGDPIFTVTSITDRFGYVSSGHMGRVKEINGNNIVTIHGLIDGFVTGSYIIYTMFIQYLSRPFIGDTTVSSNQITNVPNTTSWLVGERIISLSQIFANGTYITDITGSTVTVSTQAGATTTNEIFSSYLYDESGISYYYHPNEEFYLFTDNLVVRKGTRLTEMHSDKNELEYLCTKSGCYGTVNLPHFEPIYKLNEIRFSKVFDGTAGDGQVGALTIDSFTIPTGFFIEETLVDVGAGLTGGGAITLGIATDDVDAALDTTSGLVTTLNANVVSKVAGSLVKATANRALVAAVDTTDITAGTANFIVRLKKF